MISLWWSFLLAAVGMFGLYLTYRSQSKLGPIVGIAVQALWFAYAIATGQWWFLVSAFGYAGVNLYGLAKRRTPRRKRVPRLYLAGPMTGYPEHNYPAFTTAAAILRSQGWDVVSPTELHDDDLTRPFDWYLRRDLAALVTCDAIVLLPNWNASRGAKLEHTVATGLDMPVYHYRNGRAIPA